MAYVVPNLLDGRRFLLGRFVLRQIPAFNKGGASLRRLNRYMSWVGPIDHAVRDGAEVEAKASNRGKANRYLMIYGTFGSILLRSRVR
jgi:hypothetical protein